MNSNNTLPDTSFLHVSIIGRGNVAFHIREALKDKAQVTIVNPHTLEGLPNQSHIILISVADDAIPEVIKKLPATEALVAHTSGSVDINVFENKFPNFGVFYPLQTFTKGVEIDYSQIPVFIEAANEKSRALLQSLAALISPDIRPADSTARRNLHLASVFACNFTNALVHIASDILKDSDIDSNALIPLLKQTVAKLENLSPRQAQTGPAARNDQGVIDRHLNMLEHKPDYQEIYRLLTHIIQKNQKSL